MLRIGVLASDPDDLGPALTRFAGLADGARTREGDPREAIAVRAFGDADPRSFTLVVGIGAPDDALHELADSWLPVDDFPTSGDHLDSLWQERIVPFARNLRLGARAPRRRRASIADPDPTWPAQAARLIGRLELALGDRAVRIDHIGSTSVPGLAAKDLIDIQVVVADLDVAADVARAAKDAGFVHVAAELFGPGTEGRDHREEVCVDADPRRPVNVNIRPAGAPVWRDTLLLRDWLRSNEEGRREYAELKRSLAARDDLDIDGYGNAKATWVSTALRRAAGEG